MWAAAIGVIAHTFVNRTVHVLEPQQLLEVQGLTFAHGARTLLAGLDLSIASGQSAALVGRTGSGKSTLLGCISGMIRPRAGTVHVAGVDVLAMDHRHLAQYRRRSLGFVFQFGELLPTLSPVENVALPALFEGTSWEQAAARASTLLRLLDVADTGASAGTLSGGERQRVALARALINDPPVLIADEPTGSLDAEVRDEVIELLLHRPGHERSALLVVTHDPVLAARTDAAYRLHEGRLEQFSAADR